MGGSRAILGLAFAGLLVSGCGGATTAAVEEPDDSPPATTALEIGEAPASTVDELLGMDTPVVLAHAGGENEHPHSTAFGFLDAVRSGADVLDLDVQLSSDGVLVVQHDATVDRTTNGTGDVAALSFDDLHELDNAYWFTTECTCEDQPPAAYIHRGVRTGDVAPPEGYSADDFSIAQFSDIAERFDDFVLNIEIKGEMPAALPAVEELVSEIARLDRSDSVIVTAFDDDVVDAFAERAPNVEITPGLSESAAYVLQNEPPADGRRILQLPRDYEGIEVVNAEFMDRVHADDLLLWLWPNQRELETYDAYMDFIDMGVDGINAAAPSEAVRAVDDTSKETQG